MDSDPYHNVLLEKPPIQSCRKDEVIAWLQKMEIPSTEEFFKAELLNLTTANTS
jgi:hypothetical protein